MSASQPNESFNNNAPSDGVTATTTENHPDKTSGSPQCIWKSVDPRVIDLIYWRDIQRTTLLLLCTLATLFSFVLFSVLSVVAYASLVVMTTTLSFRIYKNVMAAVYKTGEGHPFQRYLDMDISLEQSTLYYWVELVSGELLNLISTLRRLFLVEDLVDSLKFYALMYLMTYIGSLFNATTLIILADIALFSLPKTYEVYEVEINEIIKLARAQITALSNQVKQSINSTGIKKHK
jgi:hypothetical protein